MDSNAVTADLPKKAGAGVVRDDEVVARTHLGTGNRKNPIKLLANLTGQKLVFAEGAFEPNCVLYLRNCKDCHFTVNVHSTKVMLEGLVGCYVEIAGKVITSTAEAWKCQDTELVVKTKLAWQLDLSKQLRMRYDNAGDMVQIVWAGLDDFSLEFGCGSHAKLEVGLAQMREEFKGDVNAELDQFIVRVVEGRLLHERIVRLPNGFPTTDREADKFDAESAKKDEQMRKMAAQLIKENPQLVSGPQKSRNQEQKVRSEKKLKPNDTCHCGSTKKYKKCCLVKDEEEEKKKKIPERTFRLPEREKEEKQK